MGIVCAWFSFRWYHLPIRQGAGWSWGARSRDRAWGIGVGVGSYVGPEGWGSAKRSDDGPNADLEQGGVEDAGMAQAARSTSLNGPGLDGARDSGVAAVERNNAV